MLRRELFPIHTMIRTLDDHAKGANARDIHEQIGPKITPFASMYMADVADQVLLLTEDIDMMLASVANMIDLIFNMVNATQTESMKMLSLVSLVSCH